MTTAAQITIDAVGDGNTLQYSIVPHDGSEAMYFYLYPDGSYEIFDENGPYSRVPGSEKDGVDMVHTPEFFWDNLFYDPEGNISIEVIKNEDGDTQIDIYGAGLGDHKISVVPEKDTGTVSKDQNFDDPASPGHSFDISKPPGIV